MPAPEIDASRLFDFAGMNTNQTSQSNTFDASVQQNIDQAPLFDGQAEENKHQNQQPAAAASDPLADFM